MSVKKKDLYILALYLSDSFLVSTRATRYTWLSHVTNGDLEEIDLCRFFYDGA